MIQLIGRVVFMTEKSLTYLHKIYTITNTEIQIDIKLSLSHTHRQTSMHTIQIL